MDNRRIEPCAVNVASETGRLRAVLLHRPGVEIERMTPLNAAHALYSDILNKPIVDTEYHYFSGVLERWTQVYYVQRNNVPRLRKKRFRGRIPLRWSPNVLWCRF